MTVRPSSILFLLFSFPLLLLGQNPNGLRPVVNRSNHHEVNLLGNNVNTDRADIAPIQYASRLYYSSDVVIEPTGTMVGRVFTTVRDAPPTLFDENPKNETESMSHVAITNTGERIYYTVYKKDPAGKVTKSQIYYRDKDYHGRWGAPRLLPKLFGLHGHIATHPAAGIIRSSRKQVLFFASDRPGGKGGLDIWGSYVNEKGEFSTPFNLPLNTAEDDASPFFDNLEQALFFSSKGHLSLGGYDILRSKINDNGTWSNPENLGRPINSYYDDLYFSIQNSGDRCYFSSDRPNETCPTTMPGCRDFDIYEAKLKATLKVFVFDQKDNRMLEGCNVELVDMQTAEVLTTYLNLEGNYASFGMDASKNYQIIVSKPGYFPVFQAVSPIGADLFKPIFREVFLKKM